MTKNDRKFSSYIRFLKKKCGLSREKNIFRDDHLKIGLVIHEKWKTGNTRALDFTLTTLPKYNVSPSYKYI